MTRKRLKEIGIVLATGALASVLMTGSVVDFVRSDSGFVSTAYADEDGGGGGHKGKGGQGAQMGGERKGRGGEGQRGGGGKALTDILSEDEGEDSDRPDWAQQPGREGKPGGGSAGSDTKKGGDYGDLWVILRNDDGSAVMVDGYPVVVLNDGTTTYALAQSDGELPAELASMVSEVEFGRLNIARSPSKVIDHALSEALSKLDGVVITAATLEAVTDPSGRLVAPDGSTIDSPLENLAIYKALLTTTATDGNVVIEVVYDHEGVSDTYTLTVDQNLVLPLAASAFAAASDKTGDLVTDEVMYISGFLGVDDELAALVSDYTYDRTTTFDKEATVLVKQPDGTYIEETIKLLDTVEFNTVPNTITLDGDLIIDSPDADGIDQFVQNADDAVQVIEFVHDFEIP